MNNLPMTLPECPYFISRKTLGISPSFFVSWQQLSSAFLRMDRQYLHKKVIIDNLMVQKNWRHHVVSNDQSSLGSLG